MNVLAIDPGTNCGYAHSLGPHGVWSFAGHAHAGGAASSLIEAIWNLSADYPIDQIITEGGYAQSRRGAQALEAMRAAVQIAAFRLGSVPVRIVAPSTLKLYAAGHGHAEKSQMIRACIDRLGIVPGCDNECDALWLLHMARVNKPAERIAGVKVKRKPKAESPVGKSGRRIIANTDATKPF